MVMIDAIVPAAGVLGNDESAHTDSFENGLLEYPQYTRPPEYRGMKVPEVLQNGNHQLIARWRLRKVCAELICGDPIFTSCRP